jgi:hypothetical protein
MASPSRAMRTTAAARVHALDAARDRQSVERERSHRPRSVTLTVPAPR